MPRRLQRRLQFPMPRLQRLQAKIGISRNRMVHCLRQWFCQPYRQSQPYHRHFLPWHFRNFYLSCCLYAYKSNEAKIEIKLNKLV